MPEVKQSVEGKYVHRNIGVMNNKFRLLENQVLVARHVEGLHFNNNVLTIKGGLAPSLDKIAPKNRVAIAITHSRNIQILNNKANFSLDNR